MVDGAHVVTAEHLAALRSAREAALLRKFIRGRPLTESEMAELAHILPAAALADPPPLAVSYAREEEEYAAEIGVHKRAIYRWIQLGRQAKDPCPLDDRSQMLAWWARHMSRAAPSYVVQWVGAAALAPAPAEVPAAPAPVPGQRGPTPPPPVPPENSRSSIDVSGLGGYGLEASVQMQRRTVEAYSQLLAEALKDPNDDALAHHQARYEKAVELLRKSEKSLFELQRMRGDLAPKSEFRADLLTLLTGLRGMMRRRAANIAADVRKTLEAARLDPAAVTAAVDAVVAAAAREASREEQLFRSARFWQPGAAGAVEASLPGPAVEPAVRTAA